MKPIIIVAVLIISLSAAGGLILLNRSAAQPSSVGVPATNQTIATASSTFAGGTPYHEIVDPAGFVNTDGQPITIGQYVGKKVILLDFVTYSCINCQRTFPYLTSWYQKYKDDGLIVIGIHTPEFAFEKKKANVEAAMQRFGITFPIVLDNNYGTWNAYGNRYWPRKYLIDIHGNIVYDHIGEGGYAETEQKIRSLLQERAVVLGEKTSDMGDLAAQQMAAPETQASSPETYFGSARNTYLKNGTPGKAGAQTFTMPQQFVANQLYLGGDWVIAPEYAVARTGATVTYRYQAKAMYVVAEADQPATVEVYEDGKLVDGSGGTDVSADGTLRIDSSRLYTLRRNATAETHTVRLHVTQGEVRFYTFTFG